MTAYDDCIVRVGMAPRAAGTTHAAFAAHWRTAHADAASQLPGLRGYVQNHAVLRDGRPLLPYPGFDACSELLFDDLAAMDAAFESETFRTTVQDDERGFVDKTQFTGLIARRRVLLDAPAREDDVKLLTLWRPAPGRTAAELTDALARTAANDGARPALRRREQLVEVDGAHAGRWPAACSVIDVEVFGDVEEALAGLAGAAADSPLRDLAGIGQAVGRHLARAVTVMAPPS
jgi:uncharacterized protein (TIGR02118 family)